MSVHRRWPLISGAAEDRYHYINIGEWCHHAAKRLTYPTYNQCSQLAMANHVNFYVNVVSKLCSLSQFTKQFQKRFSRPEQRLPNICGEPKYLLTGFICGSLLSFVGETQQITVKHFSFNETI